MNSNRITQTFSESKYDIWEAISQAIGGCLGTLLTYNEGPRSTIYGTLVGILLGSITIFFFRYYGKKINVSKKTLKKIFIKKFEQDILNSFVSNHSIKESNWRMKEDSIIIKDSLPNSEIEQDEKEDMNEVINWLSNKNKRSIDFSILQSRKKINDKITSLVGKIQKELKGKSLTFNSSLAEPGCVWLIEKLISLGLPFKHDFEDINGIEQARSLMSDIDLSASFIPFSTVLLSSNRNNIIENYDYVMPFTFEEQRIILERDSYGEIQLEKFICPKRGSGHYEILISKTKEIYENMNPELLDLTKFKNKENENKGIILYEPVADMFLEAKTNNSKDSWESLKNRPFLVDIIFIAKKTDFGNSLEYLINLIHLLMNDLKKNPNDLSKQAKVFYKKTEIRNKFIDINNHFFNLISDSNRA